MGRIGMTELVIILLVVLLLFGVKRLPEIGQALGKAIKEFKKAGKEIQDDSPSQSARDDTSKDDTRGQKG